MTKIPTTFEMDGLYTQTDIDNRHYIMALCEKCASWTKLDIRIGNFTCSACRHNKYSRRESKSIRSWQVTKDVKRRRKITQDLDKFKQKA